MTRMTLRVGGPVPADVVWERYARPALWSTWSPQISRVDYDGERIRAGARGTVVGLLGARADFEITAVDEAARAWSWRVRFGPVRLHLRHTVRQDVQGTYTELAVSGSAPVVLAYLVLARIALHQLVHSRAPID